jgi:hypothetical protein
MRENRDMIELKGNEEFVWSGREGVEKAMRGEASNPEWTKQCMYVSITFQATPSFGLLTDDGVAEQL